MTWGNSDCRHDFCHISKVKNAYQTKLSGVVYYIIFNMCVKLYSNPTDRIVITCPCMKEWFL